MLIIELIILCLLTALICLIEDKRAKSLIKRIIPDNSDENVLNYSISLYSAYPSCGYTFPIVVLSWNMLSALFHIIIGKFDNFTIGLFVGCLLLLMPCFYLANNSLNKIIILTDKSLIITSKENKENNYIKEKIKLSQIQSVKYKSWGNKLIINLKTQREVVVDGFIKLEKIYKDLENVISE